MERITQRSVALAVTLMLALATLAMSAPKSERSSKYLTIEGQVLQVNQKSRTLLVEDYWSKKLYSVHVPEGETFRISFGMNMRKAEPELRTHAGTTVSGCVAFALKRSICRGSTTDVKSLC